MQNIFLRLQSLRLVLAAQLFWLALNLPNFLAAAGVTVVTHGYNGDVDGWITGMAARMTNYPGVPGTNSTTYTIAFTTDGTGIYYQWSRLAGDAPALTDSGEIIVKLDWSQMAGGSAPYNISTYNVAAAVSWVLLQTNAVSDLNGHALAELPVHLIGHSRGGSLVNEISRRLGTNGVWVDHLTTLDPHPLNNDGNSDWISSVVDASAKNTYVNVLFRDNYWQKNNSFLDSDPSGESVSGAYNRQLNYLSGGYSSVSKYHSNIHLWYHGTIQLDTPASDTEAAITGAERTNWWAAYEQKGTNAGFLYSLLGGGDRTSLDSPLGLPGNPVIRDGYNQYWDLGGGTNANRTALPPGGAWPNPVKFNLTSTGPVPLGDAAGVSLYYQYGGAANLTAQFYFDRDFNPWNSNSILAEVAQPPATGTGSVYHYPNLGLVTTNAAPGTYSVYAVLTDGARRRYLYAPELLVIASSLQPPVLGLNMLASGQVRIAVNGVPGQLIELQISPDLAAWQPLATNQMTSADWTFTNPVPVGQAARFYRARLRQ